MYVFLQLNSGSICVHVYSNYFILCTIVIGFFQSSYTGIERNNSYQIPVGIVSGIPPRGFAILNIDIIPITASKYYFSLNVY